MKAHGRVIFNGDNYTEAWQKEAAKRGLPNAPNTADAIPGAELLVLEGMGHDLPRELWAQLVSAVSAHTEKSHRA